LQWKVLTPESRIGGLIIEVDHAIERIPSFLLALEDIDQQSRSPSCQDSRNERDEQDRNIVAARWRTFPPREGRSSRRSGHRFSFVRVAYEIETRSEVSDLAMTAHT
jgi:hypothetical protein